MNAEGGGRGKNDGSDRIGFAIEYVGRGRERRRAVDNALERSLL